MRSVDPSGGINGLHFLGGNPDSPPFQIKPAFGQRSNPFTQYNLPHVKSCQKRNQAKSRRKISAPFQQCAIVGVWTATPIADYNGIAIGPRATVTNLDGIAIGADSASTAATNVTDVTINRSKYKLAGTAPTSVISVGSDTIKRQITSVAARQVTGSSTDAINGSQLFATNSALGTLNDRALKYLWTDSNSNKIVDPGEIDLTKAVLSGAAGTTISNLAKGAVTATSTEAINGSQLYGVSNNVANAFGGGASVDANGVWKGPVYTIQGATKSNVGDALTSLDAIRTLPFSSAMSTQARPTIMP